MKFISSTIGADQIKGEDFTKHCCLKSQNMIFNFEQGHILLFIFDCLSARGRGEVVDWRGFGAAEAEDRRTKI